MLSVPLLCAFPNIRSKWHSARASPTRLFVGTKDGCATHAAALLLRAVSASMSLRACKERSRGVNSSGLELQIHHGAIPLKGVPMMRKECATHPSCCNARI